MLAVTWILLLSTGLAQAAGISYSREVRPILEAKCRVCHSETNRSGNVSLAAYAGVAGLVKAGDPAASALLRAITGDPPRMPKAGPRVTAAEAELIRRWIAEGAKNDGAGEDATWWSLRPLRRPAGDGVDGFIRARLKGIEPSPEADRRTLIRRLYFDLHGLPPSPEVIDGFVADRAPDAYEKLVDRLLASPRYGERWARHWLDVVHYGDSHGYDKDKPRANAWPYRDWVIESLNADKPYTRFVEEQIAGDVLYPNDAAATIATGFIAAGPWDFVGHQELREGTTDKNITRVLDRDDMVAAAMSTFVSMTAHCARCHDHKFDPIPQADYYRLQAVFAGVDRADRPFDRDPAVYAHRLELLEKKRLVQVELQPLLDKVEFATSDELAVLDDRIRDGKLLTTHIGEPKSPAEAAEKKALLERVAQDQKRRQELVDALVGAETYAAIDKRKADVKALDAEIARLPKPELVYAASSYFERVGNFRPALTPRPVHLLHRGNVNAPGDLMTPGALTCVPGLESRFSGDGRAGLARWITARDNALTWRSIVNRVWHYHFGAGIVDTPNDFGRMGSQPTHPELLDWLAVWFRDDAGGSLKKLHRLIVTSKTYRQSSAHRADAAKLDADNRLLWRMNRGRLDAESVRDAVLAAAGKLDLKMGGPGVQMFWFKNDHSPVYDYARFDPDGEGGHRRSIYRFIVRSVPDPFMERLDCPDPSLLAPKRSTTLTAIQALALWNNPFMLRMAEHLAARAREHSADSDTQVRFAARTVFGRDPSAEELQLFGAHARQHGMANLARLLFNTNEFLFVD
jgi:cytochrome c553